MSLLKHYLAPAAGLLIVICLAIYWSQQDYAWTGWRPASCMPASCFCEAIQPGAIAQPANTWSGLSFTLVGLFVLGLCRQDQVADTKRRCPNLMTRQCSYAVIYGLTLILIGLGTAFYHASLTLAGQFADLMGMYLFATFILLYNLARARPIRKRVFVAAYVISNLVLAGLLLEAPFLRRWIFGGLILAALWLEWRRSTPVHADARLLYAALLSLLAGFAAWLVDYTKILCAPTSWLQGHALWHVLGAASGVWLFFYYRSEERADMPLL
ncbi:ceramidase domain-containing protein [candidate division KSB1 bacterium]|nr:ceramidase domain-containing protein [bacterium]NUM66077.1 ceramidase domain-containing protein [candidate division KSB1 bacterium]